MNFLLERDAPFSKSIIWKLQRDYFEERGFDAWRSGEVPHYVTSNPRIAHAYAQMLVATYLDLVRSGFTNEQPLHIVELGGGSGRFAFYLLKQLELLSKQHDIPPDSFKYILTDFTQANLDFWKVHPCLQTYIQDGRLDMAIYDTSDSSSIPLQIGGHEILEGSLTLPIAVIANYLFDGIPHELYFFDHGESHRCHVKVNCEFDYLNGNSTAGEVLSGTYLRYLKEDSADESSGDAHVDRLLSHYRNHLLNGYVLVPDLGFACIRRLQALSTSGILLLVSDKGHVTTEECFVSTPPSLARHGSFSLPVNFDAFRWYFESNGGSAFLPQPHHESIVTACYCSFNAPVTTHHLANAYANHVGVCGPDDFFGVYTLLRDHPHLLELQHILSALRVSLFDCHQLNVFLPKLIELAPDFSQSEKRVVSQVLEQCWYNYFPLGENNDPISKMANLFYEIDEYPRAIHFFELSLSLYGKDQGTLYNLAACYFQSGSLAKSVKILQEILEAGHYPEAEVLLKRCQAALMEQSTILI